MDLKDPKTQKLVLVVAGTAALVYFYVFATFVPYNYRARSAEIATLRAEYTKRMNDLNRAQQLVNRLPELKREFALLNQRWQVAQELLPTEKEIASLLRKITIAGQESGVKFVLFQPGVPKPSAYITENPVQVSVTGAFNRAGSFLGEIADLTRLVNVTELKMVGIDNDENEGGDLDDTVQADFVATAYTLSERDANESAKQAGTSTK